MKRYLPALLFLALAACITLPSPTPTPTPPPFPQWNLEIHTEMGANVAIYTDDPTTPLIDVTTPMGLVDAKLDQAGYTVCATKPNYFANCKGVNLVENITINLPLEQHAPAPAPVPSPPTPAPTPPPATSSCTKGGRECAEVIWTSSPHAKGCASGSGHTCHLYVRDVARALATYDARWGLITKQAGQQQCNLTQCGGNVVGGYGEDIVAYRGTTLDDWAGYDIVTGAGAPGARPGWDGPVPIRPGNQWAPLP